MSHNCSKCKFKGFVPGSAHISCTAFRENGYDKDVMLLEMLMASNQINIINTETNSPLIQINEYGRKQGWANYPLDFDPIWVEHCSIYNEKTPI